MDKRAKLIERLAWHERLAKRWLDAGNPGHARKSEKAAARRREEIAAIDRAEGNHEMMTGEMLPPAAGWQLRAKRSFTSGSMFYPRGSTVPLAVLEGARNVQSLMDDRLVWVPPGTPPGPAPRPVVAAAVPTRPSREQIGALLAAPRDADAVKAWRQLFDGMMRLTNNNAALSEDILLADPTASRLGLLAARVDAERRSQNYYRRTVRRLSEIGAA
jgi:hypothetical protein